MFAIGDNILYPMHGAGTIKSIERKEILGESREYYCLLLPYSKMNVMIPVDNCDNIGVRYIISRKEIRTVLEILGNESQERMGLVIKKEHFEILERVAKRERSPIYNVGDETKDNSKRRR